MTDQEKLLNALEAIDPRDLDYSEWTQVGMALKHEGLTAYDWENWSARDSLRYHPGECYRKWDTFTESTGSVVTGASIFKRALDRGWSNPKDEGYELDWGDSIKADGPLVDLKWLEGQEITEPGRNWDGVGDLIKYIETLFQMDEFIGTVTNVYQNEDGKWLPTKGSYSQTAGEVLKALKKSRDIGAIIGDPNPQAGAWIRFNPLDGKGCKNENVSDYRYALVESDTMEIEKQNAIIRELELPVACLVYSGKKSLHAIVKIGADTYEEYRRRVDFLYDICKKNGLQIDTQNRNPSRLSRMPGVQRGDKKQFLVDTNIGRKDWNDWKEFIEAANDDLPDIETLSLENIPDLAEPLIEGVLRKGHKMLIAGPSKAGKSFALIELCIALAEGSTWLGWQCKQGKVLYLNLELDSASCLHRFQDVYESLKITPKGLKNLDIWNLRGASVPLDKLTPKLIRRAQKRNYTAIIIDPIYKVLTGDENSASEMAAFCNQFDKISRELGCAVIYCHHHSKGSQGDKESMHRSSGSGVFSRDPDAILDLIELEQTPTAIQQRKDESYQRTYYRELTNYKPGWLQEFDVSEQEARTASFLQTLSWEILSDSQAKKLQQQAQEEWSQISQQTAWRMEGTLREFPRFEPKAMWFKYPLHVPDSTGILSTLETRGEKAPWQRALDARKDPATKKDKRLKEFEQAFSALEDVSDGADIAVKDLSQYMDCSIDTVKNRVKEHEGFKLISSKNDRGGSGASFVRRVEDKSRF